MQACLVLLLPTHASFAGCGCQNKRACSTPDQPPAPDAGAAAAAEDAAAGADAKEKP